MMNSTTSAFWNAARISSPFGAAREAGRKHRGTDFAHARGTAVPSPINGIVTGKLAPSAAHGFGNQVTIRADSGPVYSFAHLGAASPLAIGARVSVDQTIGAEGSTGSTTGPCVHVEVNTGAFVDPAPFIAADIATPAAPVTVVAIGTIAPPFPLPAGSYFGPKSGPAASVSGYFSHREDFRMWQTQMKSRGWDIDPDGLYGNQSGNVAEGFQSEKHLVVDRLIGPVTWAAAWTEPVT